MLNIYNLPLCKLNATVHKCVKPGIFSFFLTWFVISNNFNFYSELCHCNCCITDVNKIEPSLCGCSTSCKSCKSKRDRRKKALLDGKYTLPTAAVPGNNSPTTARYIFLYSYVACGCGTGCCRFKY